MAAPTITPTTSILGYRQWEYFEYQPYASNTPTGWTCARLPSGLSIDSSTGKISGAASVPGVFECPLIATNGDGSSAAVVLTFGIEASAIQPTSGIDAFIDVVSRKLTIPNFKAPERPADPKSKDTRTPILAAKANDDILLYVRFTKGGVVLDLPVENLNAYVKEFEPDDKVAVSDGWVKQGTGSASVYLLHVRFDSAALAAALDDFAGDAGTWFEGLFEIEWIETSPWEDGPVASMRASTQTERIDLERDLGQAT